MSLLRPLSLDKFQKNTAKRERYRLHMLVGLTASLVVIIACVRWWPIPDGSGEDLNVYDIQGQELIEIEEILQTTQQEQKPPPPAPIPPVVVPDDVVLEEMPLDITDNALAVDDPGDDLEMIEAAPTGNNQVARADRGPVVMRIVQPVYSRAAKRAGVRAAIEVRVLVDRRGYVESAEIVGRFPLDKDGNKGEAVSSIGFGVEEEALKAARKWGFRPAIENNQLVASYTTVVLQVGVD